MMQRTSLILATPSSQQRLGFMGLHVQLAATGLHLGKIFVHLTLFGAMYLMYLISLHWESLRKNVL